MASNQKVQNWVELAKRDLAFAKDNVSRRNFRSYAPHFSHQALEKLVKGLLVQNSDKTPPYIHNLVRLVNLANIEIDQERKEILASLNPHYIGTKYPEDIAKMFKLYTQTKVEDIYNKSEEIFKWLLKQVK